MPHIQNTWDLLHFEKERWSYWRRNYSVSCTTKISHIAFSNAFIDFAIQLRSNSRLSSQLILLENRLRQRKNGKSLRCIAATIAVCVQINPRTAVREFHRMNQEKAKVRKKELIATSWDNEPCYLSVLSSFQINLHSPKSEEVWRLLRQEQSLKTPETHHQIWLIFANGTGDHLEYGSI